MPLKVKTSLQGKSNNLNILIGNLQGDAEKFVKEAALIGEQIYVDESPVDTGNLRANFFVSGNLSDAKTFDRKTHSPSNPKAQPVLAVLNNVNYVLHANVRSFRPNFLDKSFNKIGRAIKSHLSFSRKKIKR